MAAADHDILHTSFVCMYILYIADTDHTVASYVAIYFCIATSCF